MTKLDEKYTKYARDVTEGKVITGKLIKLACQRYLRFLERDDLEFRPEAVDRVVTFISKLKHYTGKSAGKNFILEPWQHWIVCNIYGFYDKKTGLRVTTKAFILVARKNGKSAFASALCLYHLIADNEEGAQVLNVANSRDQSKLLFDMSSNMAKTLDPKSRYLRAYRDRILFDKTKSFSRCLSTDATGLDGLNSSFFVADETHSYKDSTLWDVLISSQGFRTQPLALQISTAGFNLYGFCKKYRDMCSEVLYGVKEDDTLFSAIYEMDDGDDFTDESNWLKCNPNLDITVTKKYLQEQVISAKNNASLEVGILTKNFNKWCNSSNTWLGNDLLLKYSKSVNLEDFKDSTCHIGIDLAAVSDLTAVSIMVKRENIHYFKTFYYLPQSALANNVNSELYKEWKRKGYLTITPGNVTDYDYVLNDILKVSKILPIEKIAYDSYNATQFAINATEQNLPLEPFSQALWNFNRPTKEFERLLKQGNVVIDNNEITRWCFNNVVLKYDHNDNCKPVKEQDMNKIDGVIAIVEALGVSLKPEYDNSISY